VSDPFTARPADHGRAIRYRLLVLLMFALLVALGAWLALIIATRVEAILAPGQIDVGGLSILPGVQDNETSTPEGRVNILVMGLDRRPSEGTAPTRTDTMFVLTLDPATKTGNILSIPRDLWVKIPYPDEPGYFEGKINGVFVTGATQGYDGGGPALVRRVLQDDLGISVDHYVLIDFEAFIEVIDDLGGIDVDVPEVIDDPYYSETERPGDYTPLHFEPGLQHMDGQTALNYSRTRYGNSDLDRIRRQQLVVFAALDKAVGLNLIAQAPDLWARYKESIETDINDIQIPGYAALAQDIPPERIYGFSLGQATVSTSVRGQSVLVADPAMLEQLVAAVFSDPTPLDEEAALVEVQNGAGVDGLAANVVQFLTNRGVADDALTAADVTDGSTHAQTEIIDFSGKPKTSERLASALGVSNQHIRQAGPEDAVLRRTQADVVVILGSDAQTDRFRPDASASGG
jgi:LCP family protein required for cell wall assembly